MPNYLILKRTGPEETDLQACQIIRGKSADEVEDAIKEGATAGEGSYLALSMSTAVERDLHLTPQLSPPEG